MKRLGCCIALLLASASLHAQEPEAIEPSTRINDAVRIGIPASLLSNRWDSPLLHLVREVPHNIFFNNTGQRTSGEFWLGASANLAGVLADGDDFTATAALTDERGKYHRLSYLVTVGDYGTRIGLRYVDQEYRRAKELDFLGLHGQSRRVAVQVLQPVQRSTDAGLFLRLMHEDSKERDQFDLFSAFADTRVQKWSIGMVGFLRDRFYGGGLTGYSVNYYEGSASLGPDARLIADQAGLRTHGPFAVMRFSASRLQRLNDEFGLSLEVYGQRASKNLVGSERLALGGAGAVSAYPPGEVLGDQGYVARAALVYVVPGLAPRGGSATVAPFYEEGVVRVRKDPLGGAQNRRSLAAYGVSFNAGKSADYSFVFTLSWREDSEVLLVDQTERRPRALFQFVKWF